MNLLIMDVWHMRIIHRNPDVLLLIMVRSQWCNFHHAGMTSMRDSILLRMWYGFESEKDVTERSSSMRRQSWMSSDWTREIFVCKIRGNKRRMEHRMEWQPRMIAVDGVAKYDTPSYRPAFRTFLKEEDIPARLSSSCSFFSCLMRTSPLMHFLSQNRQ